MADDAPSHVEWVRDLIQARTGPEHLWTSRRAIKAQARKADREIQTNDVVAIIDQLAADGEIIVWHGPVASAQPEHLRRIVQAEAESSMPRQLLVARANKLLQQQQ